MDFPPGIVWCGIDDLWMGNREGEFGCDCAGRRCFYKRVEVMAGCLHNIEDALEGVKVRWVTEVQFVKFPVEILISHHVKV